jgi:hypothetical protein
MEYLGLGGDLTYSERPIRILDTAERVTRSKVIKMCKVQWSHHTEDEVTWNMKKSLEHITQNYNRGFPESFKGGRFVTLAFCNNKILLN